MSLNSFHTTKKNFNISNRFLFLQVTWIRHRDVHILTVGEYTYTTDQRFMARHNHDTDEWVLVIKYVQERDAGIYECQIPSSVPRSYPINLNIVGKSNILVSYHTLPNNCTSGDFTVNYATTKTIRQICISYLYYRR